MQNQISEQFEFDGKKYEIKATLKGNTVIVKAFLQGSPANGYTYQVTLPNNYELEKVLSIDSISYLVDRAKEDISERRWERVLKVIDDS